MLYSIVALGSGHGSSRGTTYARFPNDSGGVLGMYIKRIRIDNIRSIEKLDWEVEQDIQPGWHVIIGDNGAGKSSFLRAIALTLIGPSEAIALRQSWEDWLSQTAFEGSIRLDLDHDTRYDFFSGPGNRVRKYYLPASIIFKREEDEVKADKESGLNPSPERHIWGKGAGWFSASYGPFRRFSGGDKDYERIFISNPKLAAHLSLFGENVALTECMRWLQELEFKRLENSAEGLVLNHIKEFINQPDFLPHKIHLDSVSSKGVDFVDGNGCKLRVESLSDGYRSVLSMTFELIRQLLKTYRIEQVFSPQNPIQIALPGVVLIDEIDAHLHPTWQQRIGWWFCKHFPNMQFIVTTHSPLICQAAQTIYRLPKPGSEESGTMPDGQDFARLRYGNVLDAYSTEAFGEGVTRSQESKEYLRALASLNQKEIQHGLTKEERTKQAQLRKILATSANTLSSVE